MGAEEIIGGRMGTVGAWWGRQRVRYKARGLSRSRF